MLNTWVVRLRALFRRAASEAELDEELRLHLERDEERHALRGLSAPDARAAARRAFGNVGVLKDEMRDSWQLQWLDALRADVRFALRSFRHAPSYAVTVVGTLALGLGLITTVFTLFNAYALRPMAVRDPQSLYQLGWTDKRGWSHRSSWPQFAQVHTVPVSTEQFAFAPLPASLNGRTSFGMLVTGDYFRTLGDRPALGRLLLPDDVTIPVGLPVIVLSHQAWQHAFGGDSSIVGRAVRLNGLTVRVVGVTSPTFTGLGPVPPDFWVPLSLHAWITAEPDVLGPVEPERLNIVLRLSPDVSVKAAQTRLNAWLGQLTSTRADSLRARSVQLTSLVAAIPITTETVALFAPVALAFLLVMLIACANVANVMLARGLARQREIGVRLALGASRARLVRQLLTECLLLSLPGAALGFLVSRLALGVGVRVIYATIPPDFATFIRVIPLSPDVRVFAFVLVATCASAVAFGLIPALQATRPNIVRAAHGEFDSGIRPNRLRGALVTVQVTVCTLLLICTGVLLRATQVAHHVDVGLTMQQVVQFMPGEATRPQALRRLSEEDVVREIAAATSQPFSGIYPSIPVRSDSARETVSPGFNFVTSNFFGVLGIRLMSGRSFTDVEERERLPVTVISEALAARLWPNQNPIGHTVLLASDVPRTSPLARMTRAQVIGVAANSVSGWIGMSTSRPVLYFPTAATGSGMDLLIKVTGDAEVARQTIEHHFNVIDDGLVQQVHTLNQLYQIQVTPFRMAYWVAAILGAVALLLTVTGIYGVLSYIVAQRTREIGIRMALGATTRGVVGLVLRQLSALASAGMVFGTVLAIGVSGVLANAVVIVNRFDPFGYAVGVCVLLVACLAAAVVPSHRVTQVDPVTALRVE